MAREKTSLERLREARIAKGMTQADLAEVLECSQSAISRFEKGRLDALSNEKILQLAKHLGVEVDLTPASKELVLAGSAAEGRLQFCASVWCPSCIAFRSQGRLCLMPTVAASPRNDRARFCDLCGEPLQDRCPKCKEPVTGPGAFCRYCGSPLVRVDQSMAAEILMARREYPAEGKDLKEASDSMVEWHQKRLGG